MGDRRGSAAIDRRGNSPRVDRIDHHVPLRVPDKGADKQPEHEAAAYGREPEPYPPQSSPTPTSLNEPLDLVET
jgi:hypothetical protein